ncbi:NUP50 (Nucleoporin 50 kDa) protein [Artemisia annua]|uniref:NUP50 (Nucleoporin 50 kDa) protein n=1 Tax=Artemisia annua TaxID=35608 RepID=A0A2U1QC18_ARTAN|nr:NUP50 (Nucleoporin 50 kDa) protein [Artemisia annua]
MGDAENTFQPSKKRVAGSELSRDNPGLNDEEEVPGQETSTFKRASEEVIANRRIVEVKHSQPSSTPSSNPFAASRLLPPTDSTHAPEPFSNVQETEKTASEKEVESPSSLNKKSEKQEDEDSKKPENKVGETEPAQTSDEVRKTEPTDSVAEKENDGNKDTPEGNDKSTTAPASFNSFQQLSSSQNAFTGLVGTGFSSSTFSFGSFPKTDNLPTFPSFSFGTNVNTSLFSKPEKTERSKIPCMHEVQVETGEENDRTVFTSDSALFEFIDGGWKERGKGELKVNVSTSGSKKARLVMRARGNYRLILNASIFPNMKLTKMDKKGITFACLSSTSEGKYGLSTFALKFRDASIVDEFRSVVMAHKGNTAAPSLKTPENSPKASDELASHSGCKG